jgi:hypothetical protein
MYVELKKDRATKIIESLTNSIEASTNITTK